MTIKAGQDKFTKSDVLGLIHRYEEISKTILGHPKFDDETRQVAVEHAARYIVVLGEVAIDDYEEVPDELVVVVTLATEYAKHVDEFCSEFLPVAV